MTVYRTSEKPAPRVETIAIARPKSWWIGIVFGTLLFVLELGLVLQYPSESRFTCRRDDAGHGSCEHVRHYIYGDTTTRWDVATLRGAHVITLQHKGRPIPRLVAVFDAAEARILTSAPAAEQAARADRINDFVSDASKHDLELHDDQGGGPNVLGLAFVLVGLGLVLGTFIRFPARRVVLDEGNKLARFERRAWTRWRPEGSLPLDDLAAIEAKIASKKPVNDVAITKVRAFLDESRDDDA